MAKLFVDSGQNNVICFEGPMMFIEREVSAVLSQLNVKSNLIETITLVKLIPDPYSLLLTPPQGFIFRATSQTMHSSLEIGSLLFGQENSIQELETTGANAEDPFAYLRGIIHNVESNTSETK